MDGFRGLVGLVQSLGINCDVWVDGSFLTEKTEPGDLDMVICLPWGVAQNLNKDQQEFLQSIGDSENRFLYKAKYYCDPYVFPDIPPEFHPTLGRSGREVWLRTFGRDRAGNPKGIAVLSISDGVV